MTRSGTYAPAVKLSASVDWRIASAQPMDLSAASRRIAPVMNLTVASELTSQCETKQGAGLRINEGAGEPGERFRTLRAAPRRVAAERITQSASSFSAAISAGLI